MREQKWILIFLLVGLLAAMMVGVYYLIKYYEERGPQEFLACGCGCCDNNDFVEACLYKEKGQDIQDVINGDIATKQLVNCEGVGCSQGVLYKYCD